MGSENSAADGESVRKEQMQPTAGAEKSKWIKPKKQVRFVDTMVESPSKSYKMSSPPKVNDDEKCAVETGSEVSLDESGVDIVA